MSTTIRENSLQATRIQLGGVRTYIFEDDEAFSTVPLLCWPPGPSRRAGEAVPLYSDFLGLIPTVGPHTLDRVHVLAVAGFPSDDGGVVEIDILAEDFIGHPAGALVIWAKGVGSFPMAITTGSAFVIRDGRAIFYRSPVSAEVWLKERAEELGVDDLYCIDPDAEEVST